MSDCKNCRWCERGECRRFPPQSTFRSYPNGPRRPMWSFPPADTRCGAYSESNSGLIIDSEPEVVQELRSLLRWVKGKVAQHELHAKNGYDAGKVAALKGVVHEIETRLTEIQ